MTTSLPPTAGTSDRLTAADRAHLLEAIRLSAVSRAEGRHPFAALVVDGDGAVVAAASVVRGEVPPHTLVAGAPARVVRELRT